MDEDDDERRDELELELLELQKEDEFGKQRIRDYQKDHKDLETQPDTIILSLDFTSTQTTMADDFNDCVIVFATQSPLVIPAVLSEYLIAREQPSSFLFKDNNSDESDEQAGEEKEDIERPKKTRRTKEEMTRDNIQYPKPNDNHVSDVKLHKKRLQVKKV